MCVLVSPYNLPGTLTVFINNKVGQSPSPANRVSCLLGWFDQDLLWRLVGQREHTRSQQLTTLVGMQRLIERVQLGQWQGKLLSHTAEVALILLWRDLLWARCEELSVFGPFCTWPHGGDCPTRSLFAPVRTGMDFSLFQIGC